MQTSKKTIHEIAGFAKRLYEHGFSFLAFLLMLLVFAVSGSISEELRLSGESNILPSERASSRLPSGWRDSESNWLSGRATELTRKLRSSGIHQVTVYSRVKSDESASEKAGKRGIQMTDLNDFYGMRVVVGNELDVYRCLNMICEDYPVVPGTMKNYIVSPKASGYQSIHVVTVMDERRVEFQLRTEAMHLSAEAEHEAYKQRMRTA